MDFEKITADLDPCMIERYQEFFSVYKHQRSLFSDLTEKTYIGQPNKVCRFCFKSYPEVKFKKDAHVIPQAIGNRYLLSYFECDTCNKFFGDKYENSFANYLSPIRPFAGVANPNKGSDQRVRHREKKTSFEIRSRQNGIEFYVDPINSPLSFSKENSRMTVNAMVPSYSPLYVFKTLMKIGLSMLDDSEMKDFELTLHFLQDNSWNAKVNGYRLFSMFVYYIPGPTIWPKPFALLHTKVDTARNSLYPEKVISLYFASRVFQIFIPFNRNDEFLVGKTFRLILHPLPIDKDYFSTFGDYGLRRFDMSSDKIINDARETIELSISDAHFASAT